MSLAKLDLQALPQLKSYWICNWFLKKDKSSKVKCARDQNVHRVENTSSEVFAYIFMNKFFAQQHYFFLHQLTYFYRLWEFDDQVILINDITHIIEITMILDEHIKKLFFYVIELNQYLIIMNLSWLHHHVIDINFEHNILILFFIFCLNHCYSSRFMID